MRMFHDLGDCQFGCAGHPGHPGSARVGGRVGALNTQLLPTEILPSLTLAARLKKALPRIVAPDVTEMTLVDAA